MRPCINHAFLFPVFCRVISEVLLFLEGLPPQELPIHRENKTLATPLLGSHTPGRCSSALITAGPGTRQLGAAPEHVVIIQPSQS